MPAGSRMNSDAPGRLGDLSGRSVRNAVPESAVGRISKRWVYNYGHSLIICGP